MEELSRQRAEQVQMSLAGNTFGDVLTQAAITKYYELGGLDNRNLLYHSSGGWKSDIRVPSCLGSGESSLPGFQMAPSHCIVLWLPLLKMPQS